jgi:hypothetical protein
MKKQTLEEVLDAPREDLLVEDQTEVVLEPENELVSRARHAVEVRAFEDLQALHLVPEWLSERTLQEAIARDDDEARSLARGYMTDRRTPCDCDGGEVASDLRPFKLTYRSEYRRAYVGIRKAYHPNLAALMTDGGRGAYDASDIHVSMVHGWYSRFHDVGAIVTALWFLADVEIGKGATLALGPAEKGLYCGDLRIHVGGKLLIKGSGAKIRCASARGNLS